MIHDMAISAIRERLSFQVQFWLKVFTVAEVNQKK